MNLKLRKGDVLCLLQWIDWQTEQARNFSGIYISKCPSTIRAIDKLKEAIRKEQDITITAGPGVRMEGSP